MAVQDDIKQMQAQIAQYQSVTQFGVRVQEIEGPGNQEGETGSITAATGGVCRGTGGDYNAGWQVGNWGDTLTFTKR